MGSDLSLTLRAGYDTNVLATLVGNYHLTIERLFDTMFGMEASGIRALREAMQAYAASFDPALIDAADAVGVVAEAARIKHIAAAVESLAAARVAGSACWRGGGYRSAADWLARATGT